MGIPVSGLILIPVTLGIFLFSSYSPEWAIFSAVLEGAALVNIGGGFAVGLSPYFFVVALIALRTIPQWVTGRIRFFPREPVANNVRILAIFIAWCVFSAFVLPVLFAGLPVQSPRAGVDQDYYIQTALQWSPSNGGQAGYMILNFVMVMCLVQIAVLPGRLERLVSVFSWSGVFVAAVGTFQIFCNRLGLPFPSWLFNSNQAWAQLPNQFIGNGFSRMSATFVEPSEAAGFLAAWSVFELSLAISGSRRNGLHWLWAAVGSFMLVETTSTTGYVTAAVMWGLTAWDCLQTVLRSGRIKAKATIAVLTLAGAVIVALIVVPDTWLLLDAVLFDKGMSKSAVHRTATFGRAIEVFENSWGLGVGLGSNRAMSVFFYVLSNLGLVGIALILYLLFHLYSLTRSQLNHADVDRTSSIYARAIGMAFIADVLSLLVSGAEITQPRLWILWGILLAANRRLWMRTNHPRQSSLETELPPQRSSGAYSLLGGAQNRA
jgi:hypothetical protein